ncbi:MAG: hypothetical protein HY298_12780 [Verrucomicrobia bacterium]|nr:hypothetical protein [Verrucomicrobiota bacterium]
MEKPHKPGTVLDESGNPISKPADTVDDLNLPPGTQRTSDLDRDISNKQASLAKKQIAIDMQQHIQELLVDAKGAGSLAAYREIQSLDRQTNSVSNTAKAAVTEINLFFNAYAYGNFLNRVFADSTSAVGIETPVDQAVFELTSPWWTQRETAAYRLAELKKDNTIAHLCEALIVETNLFVVAKITRALNEITGQSFQALEIESVEKWWNANKGLIKYLSPYRELKVFFNSDGTHTFYMGTSGAKDSLAPLKRVSTAEPAAWWARSLLGSSYMVLGDMENAEKEFAEVEKALPHYGELQFNKAYMYLIQYRGEKAVEPLNKALLARPSLEKKARELFPREFLSDPRMKWPSAATNSNNPNSVKGF